MQRPSARHLSLGLLLIAALWTAVTAAADTDRLTRFLSETREMRASFTQEVRDMDGAVIERSTGTMALERPDRFRWDYREPAEQHVISDGRTLWLYDPELLQVSVRPLGQALANTPALLLGGDLGRLEENFIVTPLDDQEGIHWYELVPRDPEAIFQQMLIGFRGETLAQMELTDHLGQSTRLTFSDVETNPALDPVLFEFTPPPGVDVIGEGG